MDNYMFNKNSKVIVIPNGVTTIDDEAFMDYENLEEVIIPDSVNYIGKEAFKGCRSLKKVKLSNNLGILDAFAFSECTSLEEITIPTSLHYFSNGVFSHCHNLKKINSHDEIDYIDDLAFYNCKKLEEFNIPKKATSIGKKAFMGCDAIKEINILKSIKNIDVGAFALMSSLEKITVDLENEKYFAENEDTVLLSKDGSIIQYAINCDEEEFIAGYYTENFGEYVDQDGNIISLDSNALIYNILDYAFAGAKKLKKIYFSSELESIGGKTFLECDNLKDLEIFHSAYGDAFLMHVYNTFDDDEAAIPFENIIVGDGINTLCDKMSDLFKNAKKVTLPNSLEHVNSDVFLKSKNLDELKFSNKIKMISPNTFHPNITLSSPVFGKIKAKDFNMLQTKTNDKYSVIKNEKDNIRMLSLSDGTYYVKIADYETVKVTKDEINKLSNSSKVMADKPDQFISYLFDLLSINVEYNRILTRIFTDPKLEGLFDKFVVDLDYVEEIANKKVARTVRDIVDNSGVFDEFLFTGMVMMKFSEKEIIKILENYNTSINRFFRFSGDYIDSNIPSNVDRLIKYCNLLEKYQVYDKFLYNPKFFQKLDFKKQELLVKHYNKNIKHLLNNSKTLDDNYLFSDNLSDLLNLCSALGVFSDDERISQKMTTFINEKMFNPNKDSSIVGDRIHTIFESMQPREEIDYEFIAFFVDNYEKLIELEKENSGIISRIYNIFREISKTSTSHRGEQRHLKVTINKCLDYFFTERFEGVTEKNKELAELLRKYYSEPYALGVAEMIIDQSKNAPRNIFSKVNFDNVGNPIYSYDSSEDLFENNTYDFSYQWLPKQDYNNLILGKYCGCCAHILGAGAGIMRASMILDNCQNLVIRNKVGEIIAKMTIYVNKQEGYAVFNTAEVNTSYKKDDYIEGIYNAFMRGTNAFVDTYNKNNDIPITLVSIGDYRNSLRDQLGNIETKLLPTPNFSSYGYYAGNVDVGTYDGDCREKQLLVLSKKLVK